jgi:hypothetical protein
MTLRAQSSGSLLAPKRGTQGALVHKVTMRRQMAQLAALGA